jgi:signal peptidase II
MKLSKSYIAFLVVLFVLIIDQCSKIWIKTNVEYGDGFLMFGQSWAQIHFVENEGMAFGLSFGGITGKYILSVFRIVMVGFLLYLLRSMIKAGEALGLIVCFSMIVAGAIGNILDSMFYGLIFSKSFYHGGLAHFVPFGTGYAPFLQGSVVDMLYFPLIDTTLPGWVPFKGGDRFEFFRPVFNIADSSITVGVTCILLFYRRLFFAKPEPKPEVQTTTQEIE